MRQELARLEADVALCERCFGPERRLVVRYARPPGEPAVLLLAERPPRAILTAETRLGLDNSDPGTRFLVRMLEVAGIPGDRVLAGTAIMCRPASRRLESAVGESTCLRECAVHVRQLVEITAPRLVVPLGKAALRSLRFAFPERAEIDRLRFPESVGRTIASGSWWIHPLYHVTARARLRRRDEEQQRDWQNLGETWRRVLSEEACVTPD